MTLDEFRDRFEEEAGYLDFARIGPMGRGPIEESTALSQVLATARFGSLALGQAQPQRAREAVAALGGFRADQVALQPNTAQALMHVAFGLSGKIALSPREFPALTIAVQRAATLGRLSPIWVEPVDGRMGPDAFTGQLRSATAVAVSLVDYRTGAVADLAAIRKKIGDRLLIVDAAQGFGVVDAALHLADVVTAPGHKWLRAGQGTGFLALSDRAREQIAPLWSGYTGTEGGPTDVADGRDVPPPASDASAFSVSHPDAVACARLAAACEELAAAGVATVAAAIAERAERVLDIADEFGIPVGSPRDRLERAGIVTLVPEADVRTLLAASLHNHGVTATVRDDSIRVSVHATTTDETLDMLRAACVAATAA